MSKFLIVILISFVSQSCAILFPQKYRHQLDADTEVNSYKEYVSQWLNEPMETIVKEWGIPAKSMDLPDGSKALEYYKEKRSAFSTSQNGYGGVMFSDTARIVIWCKTTFFVSKMNTASNVTWNGNGCPN